MNMLQGYAIRRATEMDLEAVTDFHLGCFTAADHIPVIFGKDYVRATYRWQLTQEGAYVLVAVDDQQIIGLVSVSDAPYTAPMFKACLGEMVASLARHPALLIKPGIWGRLKRRSSGGNHPANALAQQPGMAQLMIIAVDEQWRRQGVSHSLLCAASQESRERGSRAVRAGVYRWNVPSQEAFLKAGWKEAPLFETEDTKYYLQFLDPGFEDELAHP